jgi:hypothetical protein
MITTRHASLRLGGVAAEQHGHYHQTGAVRRSHQKRPDGQVSETYLHTNPSRAPTGIHQAREISTVLPHFLLELFTGHSEIGDTFYFGI